VFVETVRIFLHSPSKIKPKYLILHSNKEKIIRDTDTSKYGTWIG